MGFDTNKWLGFLCLTSILLMSRVWKLFLTKGQCDPLVEDDKRISIGKT